MGNRAGTKKDKMCTPEAHENKTSSHPTVKILRRMNGGKQRRSAQSPKENVCSGPS